MNLFNKLIKLAIKKKYITATVAVLLIIAGAYSLKTLDIEAYPDFTNPMVQVITQMPGKSAEEVERLATIPLEKNLNGIPNEKKNVFKFFVWTFGYQGRLFRRLTIFINSSTSTGENSPNRFTGGN